MRQCRSEIGRGVKGAVGHTEPNWIDDEREKLVDEGEMQSSKYAGSSSDKAQDSADEMPRSKVND